MFFDVFGMPGVLMSKETFPADPAGLLGKGEGFKLERRFYPETLGFEGSESVALE